MRAAAILAATIIAVGLFLAIAASIAMSASFIGIGTLLIAAAGAVGMTMSAGRVSPAQRPVGG